MTDDPLWPRASAWLREDTGAKTDLTLLGLPASRTSLSPTHAHLTPHAIREALARYSTYSWTHDADLRDLSALDAGDVHEPDGPEGEARVIERVTDIMDRTRLLIALGGDNSITYAIGMGALGADLGRAGLVTLDAHHDLRDGSSNGSPVRRLIDAGLPGRNVVQIGIADFSNSREYADRARDLGITVITRDELRRRSPKDVMTHALSIATQGGGPVHVDLDVDVCDRAEVPGCPASAPGGISADGLRQLAYYAALSPKVRSVDITEIDAAADAPDGRTVRLGALLVLESALGLLTRHA